VDRKAFHPREPIRVAAVVMENGRCRRDENEWWAKSCRFFQNLGTHAPYWGLG